MNVLAILKDFTCNTLLDVARWILDREQAASGMKQAVSCRGQAVFDRE
jgi:hypothetical protein